MFVVEDDVARSRAVTVGTTASGQIEIRKGLVGGEDLIVSPGASLKDGQKVVVK